MWLQTHIAMYPSERLVKHPGVGFLLQAKSRKDCAETRGSQTSFLPRGPGTVNFTIRTISRASGPTLFERRGFFFSTHLY
jgi:hypothetical protein